MATAIFANQSANNGAVTAGFTCGYIKCKGNIYISKYFNPVCILTRIHTDGQTVCTYHSLMWNNLR